MSAHFEKYNSRKKAFVSLFPTASASDGLSLEERTNLTANTRKSKRFLDSYLNFNGLDPNIDPACYKNLAGT